MTFVWGACFSFSYDCVNEQNAVYSDRFYFACFLGKEKEKRAIIEKLYGETKDIFLSWSMNYV